MRYAASLALGALLGCGVGYEGVYDAGAALDAGPVDAGYDAGPPDAGPKPDGGPCYHLGGPSLDSDLSGCVDAFFFQPQAAPCGDFPNEDPCECACSMDGGTDACYRACVDPWLAACLAGGVCR